MQQVNRRDFLKGSLVAMMGATAAAALAGCQGASAEPQAEGAVSPSFTPGTYTAAAEGKMGDVAVEATFDESGIVGVQVVEHQDTPGICDIAISEIPRRIVDTQSCSIDGIAGVTLTSFAILSAVRECAKQAGGELAPAPTMDLSGVETAIDADVVVIGSGGAGLTAAIEAALAGKDVVVMEKQDVVGGSSRLNGSMFIAPDGGAQLENDADTDSKALTRDELVQLFETYCSDSPRYDAEMVAEFIDSMEDNLEFLRQNAYNPYRYLYPGWLPLDPTDADAEAIHVVITEPYLPVNPSPEATWSEDDDGGWPDGFGWKFIDPFAAKVRQMGGRIITGAPVVSIDAEGGRVSGVTAQTKQGLTYKVSAPSVVIASGGFGGSADLREKYWGSADYEYGGTYANDGAVMMMAEEMGAKLDFVETPGSEDMALYCSVGGVIIDDDARVLDEAGEPVPGLYAAGEVADIRFMGSTYPICGTCDQWSVFTGRKAGKSAAEGR